MSETKLPEIDGAMPPEDQQQVMGDDPVGQPRKNMTGGEFSSQRNSQPQPAPSGGKSAFVAKKERLE